MEIQAGARAKERIDVEVAKVWMLLRIVEYWAGSVKPLERCRSIEEAYFE